MEAAAGTMVPGSPFDPVGQGRARSFVIEGLGTSPGTHCWCGASLDTSPRAVRLVAVPELAGTLRGTAFHSPACGITYATRISGRLEGKRSGIRDPARVEVIDRMRELLDELMAELVSFDLSWL